MEALAVLVALGVPVAQVDVEAVDPHAANSRAFPRRSGVWSFRESSVVSRLNLCGVCAKENQIVVILQIAPATHFSSSLKIFQKTFFSLHQTYDGISSIIILF